ncbi:MAG TPA: hypothetical protein VGT44_18525 [Ktedonobacteraceae bacterium]|nr:hypothetical protein [Ktedonobacteraceae bacterium]
MLLSRKALQRVLGVLWLIDGLLQFQPQMFTMNMVNGIMKPMLSGQPGLFEPSLQFIVTQTTLHLVEVNLLIGVVQVLLGLGFLLLPERWVKELVIASFVWAFIVWYGGEGMSMLLTGTGSVLSGAPGAVLLYPLLGLAVYPRKRSKASSKEAAAWSRDNGLLSRRVLRWVLAGFWFFAALLQLQPNWWQSGQISGAIGAMVGQGGLNRVLVDPVLTQISNATANIEVLLNIALIAVFLAIGIGLAVARDNQLRPFLIASILMSVVIWYCSEAFGMILTGMATDFNSGLLLVAMALAVGPYVRIKQAESARTRYAREMREDSQVVGSGSTQRA